MAWVLEGAESHAYPALLSLVVVSLQTFEVLGRNPLADEVLMPRHVVASPGYIMALIADDPEQTPTGFEFESGVYMMR